MMLLAIFGLTSCQDLPYRIEWRRQPAGDEASDTTTALVTSPGDSVARDTAPARYATWRSLHGELARIVEDRTAPAPFPAQALLRCRRALADLAADLPEHAQTVAQADRLYEQVARRGPAAPHAWTLRQLERARSLIETALRA